MEIQIGKYDRAESLEWIRNQVFSLNEGLRQIRRGHHPKQQSNSQLEQMEQMVTKKIQGICETQRAQAEEIESLRDNKTQVLVKLDEIPDGGQQGAQTSQIVLSNWTSSYDMISKRPDTEETSNNSLKEQVDSSSESDRSNSHTDSKTDVSLSPRNVEVRIYDTSIPQRQVVIRL